MSNKIYNYNPPSPWKHTVLKPLLFLYPFCFTFDFRGEFGGSFSQAIMIIMCAALTVFIFAIEGIKSPSRDFKLIFNTAVVISVGLIVALLYSVPYGQIVRAALPYILLLFGIWIGRVSCQSYKLAGSLYNALIISGIISLFFRAYYATSEAGITMEEMRYQIVTPVLPTLLAYVLSASFFSKKLSIYSITISVLSMVTILLSITRSYVITFVSLFILIVYLVIKFNNIKTHYEFIRIRRFATLAIPVSVILAGIVAYIFRPDVFDSWIDRLYASRVLTVYGNDINFITRIAEAEGIWNSVKGDAINVVFGMGYGNIYEWEYKYAAEVESVSVNMLNTFWAPTWVPGHSPFTYALFFGGLVALIWQIYVLLYPIISAIKGLNLLKNSSDQLCLQIAIFSFASLVLYLSQCFTSNPINDRISAMFIGLTIGINSNYYRLIKSEFNK